MAIDCFIHEVHEVNAHIACGFLMHSSYSLIAELCAQMTALTFLSISAVCSIFVYLLLDSG